MENTPEPHDPSELIDKLTKYVDSLMDVGDDTARVQPKIAFWLQMNLSMPPVMPLSSIESLEMRYDQSQAFFNEIRGMKEYPVVLVYALLVFGRDLVTQYELDFPEIEVALHALVNEIQNISSRDFASPEKKSQIAEFVEGTLGHGRDRFALGIMCIGMLFQQDVMAGTFDDL